ncbi:MAG: hypothetical protein RLZZ502_426 [Pseudomonadota bacterium]|jgi:hypothetical protein
MKPVCVFLAIATEFFNSALAAAAATSATPSPALIAFIEQRPALARAVDMECLKQLHSNEDIIAALPLYSLTLGEAKLGDILLDSQHQVVAVRPRSSASKALVEIGDRLQNPAPKPACARHDDYPSLKRDQANELHWQKANGQRRSVWQGSAEVSIPQKHFVLQRRDDPLRSTPVLQFNGHIPALVREWTPPDSATALIVDLREAQWMAESHFDALKDRLNTALPVVFIVGPWTAGQAWQLVLAHAHAPLVADKAKHPVNACLHYTTYTLPEISTPVYECVQWLPDLSKRNWHLAKSHPKNTSNSMIFIEAMEALKNLRP